MSGRPSGIGRGIPPPSRMQMPKVGTSITKSRIGQVTTTASGTRITDAVSTSSTTVTARGPAGRLAPPGSMQRPSSGLTRPTSVTKITAGAAPGTSGRQTTKVTVSGANIRAPPAAVKPGRPSSARPSSAKSAAAKAKECGAACAAKDKAKTKEPPVSQEMPEARHVAPGRYYLPARSGAGVAEANSPAKLRQRLTKYTPTGLSHWKVELDDPFAKNLATVRKVHPDMQSGLFQVPYLSPTPEAMEPYERIKYRDLMEQTLNPYLPEEEWSMALKEAMALKEGEYEDEGSDEDDELDSFEILEAQMNSEVEAKLPETPTVRRSPQQSSVRDKSPYQPQIRSPRQQSPQQAQQNIEQQIQHLADYVDRISDGQTLVPSPKIPGLTEEQQAQLEAEKVARYVRNIAMQFLEQEQIEAKKQALEDAQQTAAMQARRRQREQERAQAIALIKDTEEFIAQEQREAQQQAQIQAAQAESWKRAKAQRDAQERQRAEKESQRRATARVQIADTQKFVQQEQMEARRQTQMQAAQMENWKRAQAQRQAERARTREQIAATQQFVEQEQREAQRQAQIQGGQTINWKRAKEKRRAEEERAREQMYATQQFVEQEQREARRQSEMQAAQMAGWQQARAPRTYTDSQEQARAAQIAAQERSRARDQIAETQKFVEYEQRYISAQLEAWQQHRDAQDRAQIEAQRRTIARAQIAQTQQFVEQEQREGTRQSQMQAAQVENWKRAQAQRQAEQARAMAQMAATQQFVEQEQRESTRQAQMQATQMANWKRAQAQRQAERARTREQIAATQQFVDYEQRQGQRQSQLDAQQQQFEAQRRAQILSQNAARYAAQQRQSPKKTQSECMPCGGISPKRSPSPSDEGMERVSASQRRSPAPSPTVGRSPRRSPAPSPTATRSPRGTTDAKPVIPSIIITPPSDTDLVGDQEPDIPKQIDTQEPKTSYLDVPKKRSRIGKPSSKIKMPSKVKIREEEKATEPEEVEPAQEVAVVKAPVTAVSKLPGRRQLRPPSKLIKFPETKRMVETRQVTPSVIETPVGPVEAKQETLVERTTQMSRKGAVVDTHVVGTRKISPGVAEQTEVIQRDVLPPTEFPKLSTSRLKFVPRKRKIPLPSTVTTRTQAVSPPPPLVSAPQRSPSPPAYISPRQPTPPAYISPRQPTPPDAIDFDLLAQGYVSPGYMSLIDDEIPPMYDSPLMSSPDSTVQGVYGSPEPKYLSPRGQPKVIERVVIKKSPDQQSYTKLRYEEIHEEEFKLPSPMYIPPRYTPSALGATERGSPVAMNYAPVGYGSASKAAYISPNQAAYISPEQAAYISPEQAAYVSPTQAAYISPTQAPYISPTQAPYINPQQAPYISPTQAPYISPTQAAYISAEQAAYVSPEQAAYVSPTLAQYVSPTQAPYISPTQAPYISPAQAAYISPAQAAYISPAPMTQAYIPPAETYISATKQSRRSPSPPPQASAKRLTQSSSVRGVSPSAQEVTLSLPKKKPPRLCMPCSARLASPVTEPTPSQLSLPSLIPPSATLSLIPLSAPPSLIPLSAPPSLTPPSTSPSLTPLSAPPSLIPPSAPPSLTPPLALPTKKPPKLCMPCCSARPSPPKKTPRICMPCGSRKSSPPPPPPKSKRTPSPTKSPTTPSTPAISLTARPPPASPTIPLDISVPIPEDLDQTNLNDIEALVAEEKADVMVSKMVSSPLKEKLQRMKKKKPKCMRLLEETLDENIPMPNHGDTMTSDIMAAMMEGEEKGIIATTKSPKKTYDTLFPPLEDEPTVEISSVSPAPLQDIMVPVGEANTEDIAIVTVEIEQVASTTEEIPTGDLYAETVAKLQEEVAAGSKQGEAGKDEKEDKEEREDKEEKDDKKETERKKKEDKKKGKEKESEKKKKGKEKKKDDVYIAGETLEGVKAPWELDISSLENLVGGKLFTSVDDILISDDSIRKTDDKFEYVLESTKTRFFSCYQSRGSQWPSWFRGYCSVFPHNPNYVKLEKSPSRIMASAWKILAPPTILNDSDVSFF